jgi:large subunit ribosomal protein L18
MPKVDHRLTLAEKRKRRVRAKLFGTAERPRLVVHRSNKYIYLQVIDDQSGKILAAASDVSVRNSKKAAAEITKTQSAQTASEQLVEQLKKLKIGSVVFDRGAYKYHGRVKAVAEQVRNLGIKV